MRIKVISKEKNRVADRYAPAFFGLRASRLVDAIVAQGSEYTQAIGITAPVRFMSTLLCLRDSPASVTEIAAQLEVTHAAVIKNVRALENMGFVTRSTDPGDARRRPVALTASGEAEAARTADFTRIVQDVYRELFEEIGIDVHAGLQGLEAALEQRSFDQRLADMTDD